MKLDHPWKGKCKKVKAKCMVCDAVYDRDPASSTKTCSPECYKQYAKVKYIQNMSRFR